MALYPYSDGTIKCLKKTLNVDAWLLDVGKGGVSGGDRYRDHPVGTGSAGSPCGLPAPEGVRDKSSVKREAK